MVQGGLLADWEDREYARYGLVLSGQKIQRHHHRAQCQMERITPK